MRVVTGGDWSIGLGADADLSSATLNADLGEGLREIYADLVEQPLPAEFGLLLSSLDGETTGG
jgi:hypothetical protein